MGHKQLKPAIVERRVSGNSFTHLDIEVVATFETFDNGKQLLALEEKDTGIPFARLSIFGLDDAYTLSEDETVFKSYSENSGILEKMLEANMLESTFFDIRLAHVNVPVVKVLF